MADELALLGGIDLSSLSTEVKKGDLAGMTGSGAFLPRIQIAGATSTVVAEGKLPVGVVYMARGKENKDLGKSINVLALDFRPKAFCIPKGAGNPMSYYDMNSDSFKKVCKDADTLGPLNGNMYGPEFLLWFPAENTFATLFCNSPTLRNAAPDLLTLMKKEESGSVTRYGPSKATVEAHWIVTKSHKWWGLKFVQCTADLPGIEDPDVWNVQLMDEIKRFKNPPVSTVEVVDAPVADAGRAR